MRVLPRIPRSKQFKAWTKGVLPSPDSLTANAKKSRLQSTDICVKAGLLPLDMSRSVDLREQVSHKWQVSQEVATPQLPPGKSSGGQPQSRRVILGGPAL